MVVDNVVMFARVLRGRGLSVVPDTVADMVNAMEQIDVGEPGDLRAAWKAVTVASPEQGDIFDVSFDEFFGDGFLHEDDVDEDADETNLELQALNILRPGSQEGEDVDEEIADRQGASAIERFSARDFGDLDPDELERARRLVATMIWQPSQTPSRRWAPAKQGRRPDMRRTLRQSVGPRGDLIELAMANRKPRRRPLIVIADVSGSMEAYAEMMLTFAHAARIKVGRVETFVFSTQLTRVTWELSRASVRAALDRAAGAVTDWSGGTKIGAALDSFNRVWSRRVCRGGPVLLIVSDGWDCGDPALLDREMARLARSVHRVIWLNPLAGRAGYAPETQGMKAVLPYVDDFLPAASLQDLSEVVSLLESVA